MSRQSAYERVYAKQGKGAEQPDPVVNSYDPQIGAAAQRSVDLAQQQLDWTQSYYNDYVTPALQLQQELAKQDSTRLQALSDAEIAAMNTNTDIQKQVSDVQLGQMRQAADQYTKYGLPATEAYYKMVQDYSAPEYQEQQAQGAIGDIRTAVQSQAGALNRQMAAAGINMSSPAAAAAMSDRAVQTAAAEAAAATRARNAAQQLGIQLTSGAADYAQKGAGLVMGFGQTATGAGSAVASGSAQTGSVASGATQGSSNVAGNAVSGAVSGASVPTAGYAGAQNAYGNTLNAWTNLGSTSMNQNGQNQRAYMQAKQQEEAGLGNFLGGVLNAGMKSGWSFGLPI